jgi:outer membrane receptor protein involved in Fe transport
MKKKNATMKTLSTLLLLPMFLICSATFAQNGKLSGNVTDAKNIPIGFVNVTLLNVGDSSLAGAAITDTSGNFSIPVEKKGNFFLQLSFIGYLQNRTAAFEITEVSNSKYFGTIKLQTDAKQINNVTVTTLRPTITQLADRMVVNVEGTAMAAGSNAYTVLSKTPGVFIDQDGNIQLNGKTGVTVMIDNKLTYLSARDLRTMLEAMPAENIKNIEVIVNPSAKYDAAGTSGILNINLKKNTRQGTVGSLYTGYMTNLKQDAFSGGGNISYKEGKWNTSLNADISERVGGREATFTREFQGINSRTYFDQSAESNYHVRGNRSARIGVDYDINSNHSVGAMLTLGSNHVNEEFLTNTFIGNQPKDPNQQVVAENFTANRYRNFTSNLHYNGKLDTSGTNIFVDFYYVDISNKGEGNFNNYYTDLNTNQQTKDLLYTNTPNGYKIYSGKIDYSMPLKKGARVDLGVKASKVISDNDFRFYFNNSGLVLDPQRTNYFNYHETISAAYANWNGNIGKKLNVQAGLRLENTSSLGRSFTTGQQTKRSYLNLFPSLFIQHNISKNYSVNYNYSRRLTRPNYSSLNPFRSYRDPYTWTEGNPFLRPQYTNSFSLIQTFKKIYILQSNLQLTKDVITEVPKPNAATATTVYTTGNVNDGTSLVFTGIIPQKIRKWWDTQNALQLSYNKYTSISDGQDVTNKQWTFLFQSIHTMTLPRNFRFELTYLYRGPVASGLYHMAAYNRLDLAVKKSLFKKAVELSVNASDVLKTQRLIWAANYNGNINEFNQYLRFRVINVSLRYNFSKGLKITNKKSGSLEELNRAN